jgi:hypothetical protein
MIKNIFENSKQVKSLGDFVNKSSSLQDFQEYESYQYVNELYVNNQESFSDIDFLTIQTLSNMDLPRNTLKILFQRLHSYIPMMVLKQRN